MTNQYRHQGETRLPNGRMAAFDQQYFNCSDPGANRRIGSNIGRYRERLSAGRPFERKNRNYPRFGGSGFEETERSLSRITSISVGGAEPVYDLELESTHSFIANGVIVHNTNIEHQSLEYVTRTLRPWAVRWEMALFDQLIVSDRLFAEFNLEGL